MNNHAGMRFWTAITNAGKTKSGAVSIQTLLSLAELGGWEIVNGQSLCVPYPEFTVPRRSAAIGGRGVRVVISLALMRRCANIPLHCRSTRHRVHHSRRLPLSAEAGRLSGRLLPFLSVAASLHRHSNLRCWAHLLDSDSARWPLEALEMHRLRQGSARESKDSPLLPVGRPALPDCRFGGPLGYARSRTRSNRLAPPTRRTGGRNLVTRTVAPQSEAAISPGATCGDPSSCRCHLPVLCHAADLRQRYPLVLPCLQSRQVLATAAGFRNLRSCFTLFVWTLP